MMLVHQNMLRKSKAKRRTTKMSQEDMSCYGARETEHYSEWVESNSSALESEFFKKLAPEDLPLDDDMQDYLENHSDEFDTYCDEQYALADHEVYN
jgi:hypothetical protein